MAWFAHQQPKIGVIGYILAMLDAVDLDAHPIVLGNASTFIYHATTLNLRVPGVFRVQSLEGKVTTGNATPMRGGAGILQSGGVYPDSQLKAGGQVIVYETFNIM
jgi:hypothetical protein